VLQLIDKWGYGTTIHNGGQINRIKHQKVLAVLKKRALRYRYGSKRNEEEKEERLDESLDETRTVSTASLTDGMGEEEAVSRLSFQEIRQEEIFSALGVQEEVLQVHGTAPGSMAEGVAWLIYKNLDGLENKISGNKKLEKLKGLIDDLEVDLKSFNKHKQNLMHKDNTNGFSQLFKGGKAEVRSVTAHNRHEGKEVG
jgi:hypothetical protein